MKKTTKPEKDTIVKLSEYQHARLRTEMWLGSKSPHTQNIVNWTGSKLEVQEQTWTPAVYAFFREIFDNALDEIVGHGHGTKIDISFDPKTFVFEVVDDGRGIPIDWDPVEKMHKATLALTHTRAGRNFGDREIVRGTNGVGSSIVVNCSEYFHVDIYRDGMKFSQEYKEGNELFDQLQIFDPKISPLKGKTGTRIVFKLSKSVFKNPQLSLEFVQARVWEIAAAHPNIKFTFNTKKILVKPTIEKTFFDGQAVIKLVIDQPKFSSQYILVPNFTDSDEIVHTTVNDIPAFNGGQHIDTFKKLFYGGLIRALEKESRKRGLTPNRSDVSEGLLIYNVTTMHAPNFDSQSKTRLINEEVDQYIKAFFDDEANLDKLIKSNRAWIDEIYERCAKRTQKRDDADINKANKKMLRTKVPSLLDATGRDRTKCILIICEGNSAASMSSAVRTPEIHGTFPLRGKIINAHGESPKRLIENQIIQNVMISIGLSFGQTADRKNLRYGEVWLAADQDPDGANITALLVNFFYLNWPELFDPALPPFFNAFMTPFLIQLDKNKGRHYWYAHNVAEYDPEKWRGHPHVRRAKGLGTLDKVDWQMSLANPQLVPLVDDGKLHQALDLIFNHARADDRKAWISLNG